MMRLGGRLYWSAAPSKLYAEPSAFGRSGTWTRAGAGPHARADRLLADQGGGAGPREWIGEPSSWPRIQHEAIVRVLAGDIADDASLADSLAAMRSEIDELDALNRESRARAHALPHRERYLGMVHDLGSG